jgi:AcrR family transcriptional regulator
MAILKIEVRKLVDTSGHFSQFHGMAVAVNDQGSSPTQTPGRRLRGVDRREDILNHAAALFVTHGPAGTTTRMIAQAVGISQPSLYAHFETKEVLANALSVRSFAVLENRIEALRKAAFSGPERLEAMIRGYIDFALSEPAAYQIAFMIVGAMNNAKPDLFSRQPGMSSFNAGMSSFDSFRNEVASLQEEGFLRPGPLDLTTQSLWASMHGICALLIACPSFPWGDISEVIDFHVKVLLKAYQK